MRSDRPTDQAQRGNDRRHQEIGEKTIERDPDIVTEEFRHKPAIFYAHWSVILN